MLEWKNIFKMYSQHRSSHGLITFRGDFTSRSHSCFSLTACNLIFFLHGGSPGSTLAALGYSGFLHLEVKISTIISWVCTGWNASFKEFGLPVPRWKMRCAVLQVPGSYWRLGSHLCSLISGQVIKCLRWGQIRDHSSSPECSQNGLFH